jgi:hypothetical protein
VSHYKAQLLLGKSGSAFVRQVDLKNVLKFTYRELVSVLARSFKLLTQKGLVVAGMLHKSLPRVPEMRKEEGVSRTRAA